MDLKKLCKAYRWARDHPERFDMGTWGYRERAEEATVEVGIDSCGTTGCLAGVIVWLDGYKHLYYTLSPTSGEVMAGVDGDKYVVGIDILALNVIAGDEWVQRERLNECFYAPDLEGVWRIILDHWNVNADTYGLDEEGDMHEESVNGSAV